MKTIAAFLLFLLPVAPAVAAQRAVDRTVPVSTDGEVTVELIAGSVHVTAWDRAEVRITGTINEKFEELEIDADDDEVNIEVKLRDHEDDDWSFKSAARLEIVVPADVELSIETISAELSIEGLHGRASIESVSGGIELRGDLREAEVECISGQIDVVVERSLRSGNFETVAGSIDLSGDLDPDARLSLESVNGNITLRLPATTSADFSVETFSGDIENEFGPPARQSSEYLPAKQLEFSLGSGGADVQIASFNGVVRLVEQ